MPAPLPDWFVEIAERVRQWGRWGDDDQLGTLNLIDDAAVRRGAAAIVDGRRLSLAMPFDASSPQVGSIPGRINPRRTMIAVNTPYAGDIANFCCSDDVVTMGLQASTHWDSLAHVSYGGQLYNGYPASSITAESGATKLGIHKVRSLTSRGVLLDVARAKGVEQLDPGYGITADDLSAALELASVALEAGDVALVRTGRAQLMHAKQRTEYTTGPQAGLTTQCPAWFKGHEVAAVATDTVAMEQYPGEDPSALFPVHLLQLRDMGLTQGQNFDLEALAADCAGDGRYCFLLEASPIPFTGALGSPVNPVAIK
ncbi:MAG: cyclase family protein [Acidimicrobiales bacterium]